MKHKKSLIAACIISALVIAGGATVAAAEGTSAAEPQNGTSISEQQNDAQDNGSTAENGTKQRKLKRQKKNLTNGQTEDGTAADGEKQFKRPHRHKKADSTTESTTDGSESTTEDGTVKPERRRHKKFGKDTSADGTTDGTAKPERRRKHMKPSAENGSSETTENAADADTASM